MAFPAIGKDKTALPEAAAAPSIESHASWLAASVVLFIFTFSYGAPLIAPVALKPIAADFGSSRSMPALANSLAWLGSGTGALAFGWIAERVGVRATVAFGAVMIGAGLVLSSQGGPWQLLIGHGLFIGLLGGGATNVPLIIYISRWFDRRRGSALALVSSGQYIAGAIWPPLISLGIGAWGWRPTMLLFGLASVAAMVVAALAYLRPVPDFVLASDGREADGARETEMASASVFALLCLAGFFCCVPMAMPPGHLVALCSDLGIAPAQGALMLSVLLGSAFVSRQLWGWLSDRVGGLYTILAASIIQASALAGFIVTQDEAGLFAVAAAFGVGFSGIIPAYVVVLRQVFPASEAAWRVPTWFFCNICGMALGGWLAGYLYDELGSYGPGFVVGVGFNVANIALIAWLAARQRQLATYAL